ASVGIPGGQVGWLSAGRVGVCSPAPVLDDVALSDQDRFGRASAAYAALARPASACGGGQPLRQGPTGPACGHSAPWGPGQPSALQCRALLASASARPAPARSPARARAQSECCATVPSPLAAALPDRAELWQDGHPYCLRRYGDP